MIKKQTINEIYLGNGILIQQYIFYCTASNTVLGGVLEAIDAQGITFNVYSTPNVETLLLQLSYFINDTTNIYHEITAQQQEQEQEEDRLSPSEREHFANWSKSKEEEEKEKKEEDIAAKTHDLYHADRAAWLASLDDRAVLL